MTQPTNTSKYQWLCQADAAPEMDTLITIPFEVATFSLVFKESDENISKILSIFNIQGCIEYMRTYCQNQLSLLPVEQYLQRQVFALYDQHKRTSLRGHSAAFVEHLEKFVSLYRRLFHAVYHCLDDDDFINVMLFHSDINNLTSLLHLSPYESYSELEIQAEAATDNIAAFLKVKPSDISRYIASVCSECFCKYTREYLTPQGKYIVHPEFSDFARRSAEYALCQPI